MIMKVRLEVIYKKRDKYPNAKNIKGRFDLSNKYFKFLGKRTKLDQENRKKFTFNF